MSDETYGYTKLDVAKEMQKAESKKHDGNISADSNTAGIQSIVDSSTENKSKDELIKERQANLELPEQPPAASGFNSADGSIQDIGSGGRSDDISRGGEGSEGLRSPATGGSAVRDQGEVLGENTAGMGVGRVPGGVASDAAAGRKTNTEETRNADKKGDPANPDADTRAPKETTLSSASEGPGAQ